MTKPRQPTVRRGGKVLSILQTRPESSDEGASSGGTRYAGWSRQPRPAAESELIPRAFEQECQKQANLLESTAHGIVSVDLGGHCTYINRAGAEMLGYEPAEVVGQSMHALCHSRRPDGSPYPAEECPRWLASHSGEAVIAAEEVFWRRDGTSFPVEFTSSLIHEDGRLIGLVVSLTDISKRRAIDKARQASESRYRTIVESAQEGIWIVDSENRTTFVNHRLADMFGYTPDEILGKTLFSFMDPEARAIAEAGMARRRAGLNGQSDFQ